MLLGFFRGAPPQRHVLVLQLSHQSLGFLEAHPVLTFSVLGMLPLLLVTLNCSKSKGSLTYHVVHTKSREYSCIFCPKPCRTEGLAECSSNSPHMASKATCQQTLSLSVSWGVSHASPPGSSWLQLAHAQHSAGSAGAACHKIQKDTGFLHVLSVLREGAISDLNSSYRRLSPVIHNFTSLFFFFMTLLNIPLVTTNMVINYLPVALLEFYQIVLYSWGDNVHSHCSRN